MGKLVAFWSPYPGRAGTTSSLCAVAGIFGLHFPQIAVAISHVTQGCHNLEEKLYCGEIPEKNIGFYRKTGIAALKLQCRQSMLSSEKIRKSAIPLSMKSLSLFPYEGREELVEELTVQLLTESIKNEFDLVFLDLQSGESENTLVMLKKADFIVVVLPQDPACRKDFFQKQTAYLKEKKYCIVLGRYLKKSKYGLRFFYNKKETTAELAGVIPLNTGFFDAMTEGKVTEFFWKNQRVRRKEENYEFIVQTQKTADYIRKKLLLS